MFATLADASAIEYDFTSARTARELDIRLSAEHGPIGTKDYVFEVSAEETVSATTELTIVYRYRTSKLARLSMDAYLATTGSGKVGFTAIAPGEDGHPVYIAGERGMLERNAMRYYLAIQAYLEGASVPLRSRTEWTSARWFDLTEQHSLQLHEIDRAEYLKNKRREFSQQASKQALQ